jgi:hypothetical protein
LLVEREYTFGQQPFFTRSRTRQWSLKTRHRRFPGDDGRISSVRRGLGCSIEVRAGPYHHDQPIVELIYVHRLDPRSTDRGEHRRRHRTVTIAIRLYQSRIGLKVEQQALPHRFAFLPDGVGGWGEV